MDLPQIGMVFGVFDGMHEGHRFFLAEARKRAQKLIIVVATDSASSARKGRKPRHALKERIEAVSRFVPGAVTVPGDEAEGTWSPLHTHRPEVVFLGYDQETLGEALTSLGIRLEYLESHRPDEFKSSLMPQETETGEEK